MKHPLLASLCAAAALWAGQAAVAARANVVTTSLLSTVIDIDATSASGTSLTLGPGTYALAWAGIGGGGRYDAWTYNTASSGNYRDAFTLSVDGISTTYDRNDGNLQFNQYASAALAIADFRGAAGNAVYQTYSGATDVVASGLIGGPITFSSNRTRTYTFSVPDNFVADNGGGVSLWLQQVPSPGTLALVAGPLAALVWSRRRRPASR